MAIEANTFIFSSGITEKSQQWVRSLVWWSVRLITGWSSVQIRPGPHPFSCPVRIDLLNVYVSRYKFPCWHSLGSSMRTRMDYLIPYSLDYLRRI